MSKLLASLVAVALGVGVNLTLAQNVDSEKDKAQGQGNKADTTNTQRPKPTANEAAPAGAAQSTKTSPECDKLSGKERDNCIQATPAGPVEMTTGQGSKGKSDIAKERDKNKAPNANNVPDQSNDTVGHPQERAATGEGKPLQDPGTETSGPSNNATTSGQTSQQPK
jgi:hypothetical protein